MTKEPRELQGLRILIVEDNFLVADMISDVLADRGCEVVGPVPSLERGSKLAREELLDGAVLDVNLAGELSFPIARTLTEREIPFLFLTGYDDKSAVPEVFRAAQRLSKPFDYEVLVTIIRQSFGARPPRA